MKTMPWLTVFKREFFGYFRSPVAYVFLTVFLISIVGLTWFVGRIFESNDASLRIMFTFLPWVYLFLIPAVGMRLWSEEKRSGTLELLTTMPLTLVDAVVGKFLAGWAFITLALLLTFPMPLTVAFLGQPDWGPIFAGYFGAILMGGAYLSICALASSLSKNQVISFVISVVVCLTLVLLGWSLLNNMLISLGLPTAIVDAIANFSFITHYEAFVTGVIQAKDILFFLGLSIVCLGLNVVVLQR